ncbi:MAG: PIG-L family deacetylase [Candidatus Pedobacter colombiensis]|uniref:PIG-L family deacetylase n=1 Tax=Candidatus Pedobacter colombiensis TaxID=3121371 RepID=A0AAJ5WAF1_9SPHI|nr:PIG-L family deacetylase [Pedobacter sp.]WEK20992.1 MAG: PIG-L family deacetylase [Pedobacter sp.]
METPLLKFLKGVLVALFLMQLPVTFSFAQQIAKPRKCILVFGAHADDVDENAGGTLAKYVALGYEGIYVCAINNLDGCNLERTPWYDKGPNFTVSNSPHKYPLGALETSQIREEEARQAAAVYPATPVFLNFKEPTFFMGRKYVSYGTDLFHEYNPPGRQQIAIATYLDEDVDFVFNLLKKYQPEIVITHTLGGEKLDHGNAAYLVYLAFKKAIREQVPVGKLWMTVNGWLLDPIAQKSGRGKPDVHIDVKAYLKVKYEALNKHLSQNGGFGRDYVMGNETQPKEVIEEFITVLDHTKK